MGKEKLWKDCLKRAFSQEVIVYSVVLAVLVAFENTLGGIFSIFLIAFGIAFGFYLMNLALTKALQRKFVIDDIQVIAANPKIGKKPAVLFCWNLAYSFLLGVAWVATLGLSGVAMRGARVDTFTSAIITCVLVVILIVVTIVAQIKWIYPAVLGHAIGEDRNRHPLADDFKEKLSLKYFLFILTGYVFIFVLAFVIACAVEFASPDVSFQALMFPVSFATTFVCSIFVCAGFIYAYSGWLEKTTKLSEIGEYFGLALKPEFNLVDKDKE